MTFSYYANFYLYLMIVRVKSLEFSTVFYSVECEHNQRTLAHRQSTRIRLYTVMYMGFMASGHVTPRGVLYNSYTCCSNRTRASVRIRHDWFREGYNRPPDSIRYRVLLLLLRPNRKQPHLFSSLLFYLFFFLSLSASQLLLTMYTSRYTSLQCSLLGARSPQATNQGL